MIHKPVKKHWYLLAFSVQHPGAWIPASFVHGFDNMRITIPELRVAKQINHLGDNSVMLAVCYMGYGTEREINGMPEVDPPSYTSDFFNEGVLAAVRNPVTNSIQPVNPYTTGDVTDPHVQHAAAEWTAGFNSFREAEKKNPAPNTKPLGESPTVLEPPPSKGLDTNTKQQQK